MRKGGGFVVLGVVSGTIAFGLSQAYNGAMERSVVAAGAACGFAICAGLCMLAAAIVNAKPSE